MIVLFQIRTQMRFLGHSIFPNITYHRHLKSPINHNINQRLDNHDPTRQHIAAVHLKIIQQTSSIYMPEQQQETREDEEFFLEVSHNQHSQKCIILMIGVMGFINNSGYVLIITGSQDIAKHYGRGSWMSVVTIALLVCSSFTTLINSRFLIRMTYSYRLMLALLIGVAGYIVCAVSASFQASQFFYLFLVGSLLTGLCQALGQSVILGFLRKFPPEYIVGWASGSGLAGPIPSLIYLLYKWAELSYLLIYLSFIPLLAIYYAIFSFINNRFLTNTKHPLQQRTLLDQTNNEQNVFLSCTSFMMIFRILRMLIMNLGLVYLFQYTILTCFAERANKSASQNEPFYVRNAYIIISLFYQTGVFISRSSLPILQVTRTWILTIIQGLFFGLWASFPFLDVNKFIQFGLMLIVGLIGGCSYVNTYHLILSHQSLDQREKELSANLCIISNNTATLSAAFLSLLLSNTIYK